MNFDIGKFVVEKRPKIDQIFREIATLHFYTNWEFIVQIVWKIISRNQRSYYKKMWSWSKNFVKSTILNLQIRLCNRNIDLTGKCCFAEKSWWQYSVENREGISGEVAKVAQFCSVQPTAPEATRQRNIWYLTFWVF